MRAFEYYTPPAPPCANCLKPFGGVMGSTEWGHLFSCCSEACGIRLAKKIKSGMFPAEERFETDDR